MVIGLHLFEESQKHCITRSEQLNPSGQQELAIACICMCHNVL